MEGSPLTTVDFKDVWKLLQASVTDRKLSPVAKLALARMLWHRNGETGRCNPSYATLADGINVGRRQLMRAVKELEADGWINVGRTSRAKSKSLRGGMPSNSFTFVWSKAASVTDDTTLVSQEALASVSDVTPPSDKSIPDPSVTGDTQNLESRNLEILNLGGAKNGALRSSERAPLPAWAKPAGNGKYLVDLDSPGGDLIRRYHQAIKTPLPKTSTRYNAFIVPYVTPPGTAPVAA